MHRERSSFTTTFASPIPFALGDELDDDDPTIAMLEPPVSLVRRDRAAESLTIAVAAPLHRRLRHPHVVTDFVAGLNLAELIRLVCPRKLPPRVVTTIFAGALRGLHAMHEERSAHRSLSSRTFFLGADGVGRVIGPAVEPRFLVGGAASGDRRADIYEVGASLWEALTGSPLGSALTGPPSMFGEVIPFALDAIVMRALSQYPAVRFATALEMANALENVFPDVPPTHEVAAWLVTVAADELRAQWNARARLTGMPASSAPLPRHRQPSVRLRNGGTKVMPFAHNRASPAMTPLPRPPLNPTPSGRKRFLRGVLVVVVALSWVLGLLIGARALLQS